MLGKQEQQDHKDLLDLLVLPDRPDKMDLLVVLDPQVNKVTIVLQRSKAFINGLFVSALKRESLSFQCVQMPCLR